MLEESYKEFIEDIDRYGCKSYQSSRRLVKKCPTYFSMPDAHAWLKTSSCSHSMS